MARVRNKTDQERQLRLTGFTAVVKPDESVEVPDALFAAYEFPETVWDVIEGHKAHRSKPKPEPEAETAPTSNEEN